MGRYLQFSVCVDFVSISCVLYSRNCVDQLLLLQRSTLFCVLTFFDLEGNLIYKLRLKLDMTYLVSTLYRDANSRNKTKTKALDAS